MTRNHRCAVFTRPGERVRCAPGLHRYRHQFTDRFRVADWSNPAIVVVLGLATASVVLGARGGLVARSKRCFQPRRPVQPGADPVLTGSHQDDQGLREYIRHERGGRS
jgi:hypothetical protein